MVSHKDTEDGHFNDLTETPSMDSLTENWPVPHEFVSELARLKFDYVVAPMRLYNQDLLYVPPTETNAVLRESLVEVHFQTKHYQIGSGMEATDSFPATFEQVVVLKRAAPKKLNAYKRKNLLEGPYRPMAPPATLGNNIGKTSAEHGAHKCPYTPLTPTDFISPAGGSSKNAHSVTSPVTEKVNTGPKDKNVTHGIKAPTVDRKSQQGVPTAADK